MDFNVLVGDMENQVKQVQERIQNEFVFLHIWEQQFWGGKIEQAKYITLTEENYEMIEILREELFFKRTILNLLKKK